MSVAAQPVIQMSDRSFEDLRRDGFAKIEGVLSADTVRDLISVVEDLTDSDRRKGGVRNLLDVPEMMGLAQSRPVRELVETVLGAGARVVRGILFDKTGGANWKVPWHQDVTIAVDRRVDLEGYGPWSVKAGVQHVQPPREILEKMLSVRIHLDDCPEENGALKVIPGTHLAGKLSSESVETTVADGHAEVCAMRSGGVLLMRPLLLHASSQATLPNHRRVIHFDFAAMELPSGMNWTI
jgi:ectoine hydroxylase-related dioxygenase (phytanoyl-CoA dioxygenase family)